MGVSVNQKHFVATSGQATRNIHRDRRLAAAAFLVRNRNDICHGFNYISFTYLRKDAFTQLSRRDGCDSELWIYFKEADAGVTECVLKQCGLPVAMPEFI
ncbi:MAG: hypothetical protein ABI822_24115, partial [Bryobacteraceae bacterium]